MKKTVLIIEDNEQNRYLATFLMEKHGFEVRCAGNGLDGLAAAKKHRPDVILLDIQLPGIDGYEVARRLRTEAATSDIPIVAVTSYAMGGDRQKALRAGCDGYLEKPINPETFVSDILAYVKA